MYHSLTTGGQYEPDGKLWPDVADIASSSTQHLTSAQVLTDAQPQT